MLSHRASASPPDNTHITHHICPTTQISTHSPLLRPASAYSPPRRYWQVPSHSRRDYPTSMSRPHFRARAQASSQCIGPLRARTWLMGDLVMGDLTVGWCALPCRCFRPRVGRQRNGRDEVRVRVRVRSILRPSPPSLPLPSHIALAPNPCPLPPQEVTTDCDAIGGIAPACDFICQTFLPIGGRVLTLAGGAVGKLMERTVRQSEWLNA
jgi:hypothetical protein